MFTKEECEKIISYKEVYTDLIWRSLEPAIDFENRRIDHHTHTKGGKKFGKFFNVWDIQNDSNTLWVFERLLKWFNSVSNIAIDIEGAKKIRGGSLHKYSKGDLFQNFIAKTIENKRIELKNLVVFADGGVPLNDAMAGYVGACINLHMRANDGVGPYPDTAVKLGCWIDNGGWMNERHRLLKQAD